MKNNDEMYQSVLAKLDAHLERQERKKLYLKRMAPVAFSLCFGIAVCFAAVKNKKPVDFPNNDSVIVSATTSASVTTLAKTSTETAVTAVSSTAAEKSATTAKTQTTTAVKTNPNRTAKATGQAMTTVKPPTATEAVTTTTIYEEVEGSVTMKKMIAFLSAMGIAATANPTGVYAENPNKIRFSWSEISWMSYLTELNWEYDMNSDGDFDIKDIFEIKLYSDHSWHYWEEYHKDQTKYTDMYKYYDEETFKHFKKIMFSEDIILDILPFDNTGVDRVARYYLYLHGEYPTTDEIREALRDYDFMTVDGPDHVDEFIEYMEKLRSEVKTYEDKDYTEAQLDCFRRLDSGETDKDVNGDGEFNYYDVYDILGYVVNAEMIARNMSIERDGVPMSDELNARVEQYGDMDLDGDIDGDDLTYLTLYLDKMNLKPLDITDHLKVMKTYTVSGAKEVNDEMNRYNALDYSLGDVDNSGKVNAIDASLVLEHYSKVSTGQSTSLDETQKKSADVNKDGSINAVDASQILSYYAYTATANGDVMTLEEYLQQ
jgi:hypothetical protein